MSHPKLSIVIPAYNESDRLKTTLPKILAFFKDKRYSKEIIFVNDGSTDATSKTIQSFRKSSKLIKLINHPTNQGKGASVRTGVLASLGDWVLFMDADLSTPLKELDNFWPYTAKHQIIIGSRKMAGANITKHQSFVRENLGKVFTFLTNTLVTKGLSDITCGFKLFKGDIARDLFCKSKLNDWSFDAEVLFLAQHHHHSIKEIPVKWQNDPRTKVNMLRDGINSLIGLLKIRLNYHTGKY